MATLFSRARWRRWLVSSLVAAIVLAGVGLALHVTHTTQASMPIHLAAPQITIATSTDVEALRASDGAVLWRAPYRNATVTTGSGMVLVAQSQRVTLLDGRTGHPHWTYALNQGGLSFTIQRSILDADAVYVSENQRTPDGDWRGQVLALAASDGHLRWHYSEDHLNHFTIMRVRDLLLVGDYAFFVAHIHAINLTAFAARDGAVRWRYTRPSENIYPIALSGNTLLIHDGAQAVLDVMTGKMIWRATEYGINTSACLVGDVVYASIYASGTTVDPSSVAGIAAYRLSDGSTLWRRALLPKRLTFPLACATDGLLVMQLDTGNNQDFLYRLRGTDGSVVWQHPPQLLGFSGTTPVNGLHADALLNDPTTLTLVDGATGAVRWHLTVPVLTGQSFAYSVIRDSTLYLSRGTTAQASATLYAIDAATGTVHWQHPYDGAFTFGLDG